LKRWTIFRSLFVIVLCLLCCRSIDADAKYYHDNQDNVYVHKRTDEKLIALTFDDGPHESKTEKILEILDKYNVKATYFIIGQNAEKHPEILNTILSKGHEIGNHTYDHKSIYKLSDVKLTDDVERCSDVIESITGSRPVLFRPPEGFMNDTIATSVGRYGYRVILWKVDTYDWKGKSAAEISSGVMKTVKSGDIILMHDYIWKDSHTAEALDIIIPKLMKQGYRFVTVSELLAN
jgi:polysaccharide deacetylase family sporulation protein PdaB